jgi:hypothetical protein
MRLGDVLRSALSDLGSGLTNALRRPQPSPQATAGTVTAPAAPAPAPGNIVARAVQENSGTMASASGHSPASTVIGAQHIRGESAYGTHLPKGVAVLAPTPLQGPRITDDPRLFSFIKQELINNRSTALAGIEQLNSMMLNPLSRPDPQPLSLRLSEPVGRELGLRDGQIVTVVVQERGDTLRLTVQGKSIDLPDNGRWQAGTQLGMRVDMRPAGPVLIPISVERIATTKAGEVITNASNRATPSGTAAAINPSEVNAPRSSVLPRPEANPWTNPGLSPPGAAVSPAGPGSLGGAALVAPPGVALGAAMNGVMNTAMNAATNAAMGTAVGINLGGALQAGSIAGGSPAGSRGRGAAINETSATVLSRLFAPDGAPALLKLLLPGLLERSVNDSQSPSLAGMLAQLRPRMARMSANDVRAALEHSGLFTEARVLQSDNGLRTDQRVDLKQLLNQLERALSSDSSSTTLARMANEEIESAQVQAVQAQARQELLFNFVIPFADAPPARLTFSRPAATREQPDPPYVVDVHSDNNHLGEVWLRSAISTGAGKTATRVDLTMWARRKDVAEAAKRGSAQLGRSLNKAGLEMEGFVVYHAARPEAAARTAPPGSILNLQA